MEKVTYTRMFDPKQGIPFNVNYIHLQWFNYVQKLQKLLQSLVVVKRRRGICEMFLPNVLSKSINQCTVHG